MSLTKFTKDLNIIANLDDEPNDVGGLSPAEAKAKFDEAGNAAQEFINDSLIPEIEEQMATKEEVQDIVLGQVPDGTITSEKLSVDLQDEVGKISELQTQIDDCVKSSDKATEEEAIAGSDDTKWMTPAKVTLVGPKIGDIKVTARTDLGDNWLLCNGSEINQSTYPDLYNLFTKKATTPMVTHGFINSGCNLYDMCYGNGYYMTISYNSSTHAMIINYTTDIISGSWTQFTFSTSYNFYVIRAKFINGKFIMLASGTSGLYVFTADTPNGSWTTVQKSISNLGAYLDFDYGNGIYASAYWGGSGSISIFKFSSLTDTNISYVSYTFPSGYYPCGIAYGNNIWCILTNYISGSPYVQLVYKFDNTFTYISNHQLSATTVNTGRNINCGVTFNGTNFIIGYLDASGGCISVSSDLTTFTLKKSSLPHIFNRITSTSELCFGCYGQYDAIADVMVSTDDFTSFSTLTGPFNPDTYEPHVAILNNRYLTICGYNTSTLDGFSYSIFAKFFPVLTSDESYTYIKALNN